MRVRPRLADDRPPALARALPRLPRRRAARL